MSKITEKLKESGSVEDIKNLTNEGVDTHEKVVGFV